MSNTPIFSIQIDYLDCYGNLQTIEIPLSENQDIVINLKDDRHIIHDKKYLRHDENINKLHWFSTKC